MKIIFSVLLTLVALGYCPAQEIVFPKLEVEASINGQKACLYESKTSEFKSVRIDIELKNAVTNKSDLPTIFDRRGGTVYGYSIYQKSELLTPGRQMLVVGFGVSSTDESTIEGEMPRELFSIVNKGETLNLKQDKVRMNFAYPKKYADYNDSEFFVKSSFYSVSGALSDKNDLNELRRRWAKIGYFWFEDFTFPEIKPVLIRFPNQENLKICGD
jgi:hypothetical protein